MAKARGDSDGWMGAGIGGSLRAEGRGGDVMPISSEYASLSEDKKAILLPDDVQCWVSDAARFLVVMERDELILKKTRVVRSLNELVQREVEPISSEDLNALIHEARA